MYASVVGEEMRAPVCDPWKERSAETAATWPLGKDCLDSVQAASPVDQQLLTNAWRLSDSAAWREETVQSQDDNRRVSECVTREMAIADYSDKEIFAMRLALEEAIVNGLKHGNRGDPAKRVLVRYRISSEYVVAEVEDEGEGFDPDQVPDPRAPEYLERPSGRGLLFMRCYTSWMRYNERGNCVTLCKCRSFLDHS